MAVLHDSEKAIGIFDSGVGGLTVYKELASVLPNENLIYLGDTARVPYGTKSSDVVLKYALQDSLFLLDQGVKLIVIACNTASAFALPYLQERLKVPVLGVIEPGAWAAIAKTRNNRVGIIGTEGTIRSQAYEKALVKIRKDVVCVSKATGLFVPVIEENLRDQALLKPLFEHYLKDFTNSGIDTLILGCTHYPLLKTQLSEYFQGKIELVDSAHTTAHAVFELLQVQNLANSSGKPACNRITVTDAPERVSSIAQQFLGVANVAIEKVDF
jgi:glutamate racemase